MVSSFRVSELQVLLGFAGRNKSGRKHDLLMRALHLLKIGCSPAVQIKIRELYRRRYPKTIEGLSDLSAIKPAVFNLDSSSSPAEPDLTVASIHPLSSSSVTPQSASSPVSSVFLQDTKPHFEMQQPSPPIPPVHPDVQLKSLPFYDVLDVLIKPTSLVQSSIQRFQEKFFIFALTPQQVREICISRDFLPGGRRDYTVQVQLRLCLAETSCPQEDNYPNSLCIKVNGKLFPLPRFSSGGENPTGRAHAAVAPRSGTEEDDDAALSAGLKAELGTASSREISRFHLFGPTPQVLSLVNIFLDGDTDEFCPMFSGEGSRVSGSIPEGDTDESCPMFGGEGSGESGPIPDGDTDEFCPMFSGEGSRVSGSIPEGDTDESCPMFGGE
ncbi:E3 SUMO-protein ligase PIAS2-like, partial [Pyrgilauda ruficollis]|uniref:E3 SUMO-protein ligase PIAS2-like n=1 Tax=Pyrgilauda ruficollis TaxID=221976 RepID=UPI001B870FA4